MQCWGTTGCAARSAVVCPVKPGHKFNMAVLEQRSSSSSTDPLALEQRRIGHPQAEIMGPRLLVFVRVGYAIVERRQFRVVFRLRLGRQRMSIITGDGNGFTRVGTVSVMSGFGDVGCQCKGISSDAIPASAFAERAPGPVETTVSKVRRRALVQTRPRSVFIAEGRAARVIRKGPGLTTKFSQPG